MTSLPRLIATAGFAAFAIALLATTRADDRPPGLRSAGALIRRPSIRDVRCLIGDDLPQPCRGLDPSAHVVGLAYNRVICRWVAMLGPAQGQAGS